jgi:hypothetical protein
MVLTEQLNELKDIHYVVIGSRDSQLFPELLLILVVLSLLEIFFDCINLQDVVVNELYYFSLLCDVSLHLSEFGFFSRSYLLLLPPVKVFYFI